MSVCEQRLQHSGVTAAAACESAQDSLVTSHVYFCAFNLLIFLA